MSKNNPLLIKFGSTLKKIRLEKKLSQEVLAYTANLDRTYVSGIERGTRNPSLVNLVKIANGLNIPVRELLEDLP